MKIKLVVDGKNMEFNNWLELKQWFYSYNGSYDSFNVYINGDKLSTLSSLVFTTTGNVPEKKEKRGRFLI